MFQTERFDEIVPVYHASLGGHGAWGRFTRASNALETLGLTTPASQMMCKKRPNNKKENEKVGWEG